MGGVKRTRETVDALEHALGGVHTSDNDRRIVRFERRDGLAGKDSVVEVDVADDAPPEREVIVYLSKLPRTPRRR
jgi:hypothetical protein